MEDTNSESNDESSPIILTTNERAIKNRKEFNNIPGDPASLHCECFEKDGKKTLQFFVREPVFNSPGHFIKTLVKLNEEAQLNVKISLNPRESKADADNKRTELILQQIFHEKVATDPNITLSQMSEVLSRTDQFNEMELVKVKKSPDGKYYTNVNGKKFHLASDYNEDQIAQEKQKLQEKINNKNESLEWFSWCQHIPYFRDWIVENLCGGDNKKIQGLKDLDSLKQELKKVNNEFSYYVNDDGEMVSPITVRAVQSSTILTYLFAAFASIKLGVEIFTKLIQTETTSPSKESDENHDKEGFLFSPLEKTDSDNYEEVETFLIGDNDNSYASNADTIEAI